MTIAQIMAILALLGAFGVPQPTVDNVREILLKTTPTIERPVYTGGTTMTQNECIDEAQITQFTVGTYVRPDHPTRGVTSTIFHPTVRVLSKCSDTLEFEITTNVPTNTGEFYSMSREKSTKIKDGNGYYISLGEPLGHVTKGGKYTFKVVVKNGDSVLASDETSVDI